MGAVIAALATAADRRLVEALRVRRALSAETAQPVEARSGLERRRLTWLLSYGIPVEATPGGRYYFVEQAWRWHLTNTRRRMVLALVLALGAVGGALWFTRAR